MRQVTGTGTARRCLDALSVVCLSTGTTYVWYRILMSMFLPMTILKEPYFILSDSIFVNRVQTYFHAVPSKMVKTEGKARCL